MPAVDTVLLPLCLGLTLLGLIVTGLAGRRGRKGRVLQGVALALAPVALYLTGLLRLLWNGVAAVGSWVMALTMSRTVWLGFGLLALCLVLWVVGGVVARRAPKKPKQRKSAGSKRRGGSSKAVSSSSSGTSSTGTPSTRTPSAGHSSSRRAPVDDDMAEIEALLKSRGID